MHGFRVSFLIATGAVAIGLLLALFLPEARRRPSRSCGPAARRTPSWSAPRRCCAASAAGSWTPTGTPVARAKVTLIDRRGRQAGATLSDEGGRTRSRSRRGGAYVLAARAAGHGAAGLVGDPHGEDRAGRPGPVAARPAL